MRILLSSSTVLLAMAAPIRAEAPRLQPGVWRAWLDSPGGELPFGLQLRQEEASWKASIFNGAERIEIPVVGWQEEQFVLGIPHYDSAIRAKVSADGARLDGEWKKRGKSDRWVKLPFHAVAGELERFVPAAKGREACRAGGALAGRWIIQFTNDEAPAVGVFAEGDEGSAVGTILTTTGDYRYLAGDVCREQPGSEKVVARLRLSAFDGAHAFLLSATTENGDSLKGDFWSGDTYHDTWTAKRAESAELPDAFTLTKAVEGAKLEEIVFSDLDGKKRSLADPAFAGKARIIEVFGTWCPNCNDASQYLVELHKKYKGRGLSVVGLAFEYSGDPQRDAERVRSFTAYHKIEYPMLLGGDSDRERASAALPLIDKLRAYPTLLVLDRNNKIRATYTGFSGPATGEEYQRFRARFDSLVEKLLAE